MATQRSFQSSVTSRILFAVSIGLLLFSAVITYRQINRLAETQKLIVHSQTIHLEYEKLLSLLNNAESGQRGFIITNDKEYLQNYFEAPAHIDEVFENLQVLNKEQPGQVRSLPKLRQLIDQRLSILRRVIELAPGPSGIASDSLKREMKYGYLLMNEIRSSISRRIDEEKASLASREALFQDEMLLTPLSSLFVILFSLLVYSLSFWRINKDRKKLYRFNQHFYASKVIEESELRHRQVVQGLPVALYTCDAQGRITLYNDAAVKLWGRAPETGVELWTGAWKLYDADGNPLAKEDCPMARTIKQGKAAKITEMILERPNGERSVVLSHPKPMRDSEGKLSGAVNMLLDVSEQRQAAIELNMLAAIVTSSDDAIISKDLQGRITSWNASAERLFGYKASEMIGEKVLRLIPPELQYEETEILEQLKQGKRVDHFETRRVSKSGKILQVSLTISPIKDARGRIVGASKIARDNSEQQNFAMEMEAKVKERTEELASLNAELENRNVELASFNHVASHDLQEPLRKIQTFISRIMESSSSSFSEKSREYFHRIQSSANRMQILIEDLLMFSRANKSDAAFEKTDLNAMLETVKHELNIDESQVEIHAEKLPRLRVIPFQIQQLLSNLIGNSIKYSKPDTRTVIDIQSEIVAFSEVPFADAPNHKKYLKLAFKDNGIGFEQKYVSNIFKLFQRLHTKSEYSGTGIGLTIVKKIVDNHEGFISATSAPGQGATFTVYLPAA